MAWAPETAQVPRPEHVTPSHGVTRATQVVVPIGSAPAPHRHWGARPVESMTTTQVPLPPHVTPAHSSPTTFARQVVPSTWNPAEQRQVGPDAVMAQAPWPPQVMPSHGLGAGSHVAPLLTKPSLHTQRAAPAAVAHTPLPPQSTDAQGSMVVPVQLHSRHNKVRVERMRRADAAAAQTAHGSAWPVSSSSRTAHTAYFAGVGGSTSPTATTPPSRRTTWPRNAASREP